MTSFFVITFDGDKNCRNQIEFYELASKVMNLTIFDCYVVKVHKSTASHNFFNSHETNEKCI